MVRAKAVVFVILLVFLMLIRISVGVGKVAKSEHPVFDYFRFFTNWSWTLQFLYELALIFSMWKFASFMVVLFVGFFPVIGTTISVYALISIVFLIDPGLLKEFVELYGLGAVVVANDAVHLLTVVFMLVQALFVANSLLLSHKKFWHEGTSNWFQKLLIVFYQVYFTPLFLLFYRFFFNPHEIYGASDLSESTGWLVLFFVQTVFVGLPYWLVVRGYSETEKEQLSMWETRPLFSYANAKNVSRSAAKPRY